MWVPPRLFWLLHLKLCSNLQDPKDDIVGAMNIGMKGFLVKTGKYIEKENEPKPYATEIFNTFADAVEWIVESIEKSQ